MRNNGDFLALHSSNSKDTPPLESGPRILPVKCTLSPSEASQTPRLSSLEVEEPHKKKNGGKRLNAIDKAEKDTSLKNEGSPANFQQQVYIQDEKEKDLISQVDKDNGFYSRRYCEDSSSFVATSDAKTAPVMSASNTNRNAPELTSGHLFTRPVSYTSSTSSLKPLEGISSQTGIRKAAPKSYSSQGDIFLSKKRSETSVRVKENYQLFPREPTEGRSAEKQLKNDSIASKFFPSVKETPVPTDFSTGNEDEKEMKEKKKRLDTAQPPEIVPISNKCREMNAESSHFVSRMGSLNSKSASVQNTMKEDSIPLNSHSFRVPLSSATSSTSKDDSFESPNASECFDRRDTALGIQKASNTFSDDQMENEKAILTQTTFKGGKRISSIISSATEMKCVGERKTEIISGESDSINGIGRQGGSAMKGLSSIPPFSNPKKRENLEKMVPLPAISRTILEKESKVGRASSSRSSSPPRVPVTQSTKFRYSGANESLPLPIDGSSCAVLPSLYCSVRIQSTEIVPKQQKPLVAPLISGVLSDGIENNAASATPSTLSPSLPVHFSSHLPPSLISRSASSSPESLQSLSAFSDSLDGFKIVFEMSVLEFDARFFLFRWWFSIFHELSLLEYVNRKLLVKQKSGMTSDAEIDPAARCFPTSEWIECAIRFPYLWIAECYHDTLFDVHFPPSPSDNGEENESGKYISTASVGCRTKVFESDSSHSRKHTQNEGAGDLLYALLSKRCLKYIQLCILEFTATSMMSVPDEGKKERAYKYFSPYYACNFRKGRRGDFEEGDDPRRRAEKEDVCNRSGTGIKDTPLTASKRASVPHTTVGKSGEEYGMIEGILFPTVSVTSPPVSNTSFSDSKKMARLGDSLNSTDAKLVTVPENTLEAENTVSENGRGRSPPILVHLGEIDGAQEKLSRFSRVTGVSSTEYRHCDSEERDTGERSVALPESLSSKFAMKSNVELDSSRKEQGARIWTMDARKGGRREMIVVKDVLLSSEKKDGESGSGTPLLSAIPSVKTMWTACHFLLKHLTVYVCAHHSASFWVSSFCNEVVLRPLRITSSRLSGTEVSFAKMSSKGAVSFTREGCGENQDDEKEGVPFLVSVKNLAVEVAPKDSTTYESYRSSRTSKMSPFSPIPEGMFAARTRANSARNDSPQASLVQREGPTTLKTTELGDSVLSDPFASPHKEHSNLNTVGRTQKNAKEALLHVVNLEATCRVSLSNLFLFLLNSIEMICTLQHHVFSSACKYGEMTAQLPVFFDLKVSLEEDVKALRRLLIFPVSFRSRTKKKSEDEEIDGLSFFNRRTSGGRDGVLLSRSNNFHWVHVTHPQTSKMLDCSAFIAGKPKSVEPRVETMADVVSAQRSLSMRGSAWPQGESPAVLASHSSQVEAVLPGPSGREECELVGISPLSSEPHPLSLSENSSFSHFTGSVLPSGNSPPHALHMPTTLSSGSSFLLGRAEGQHAPRGQKIVSSVVPSGLKGSPNREGKLLEYPFLHNGFSARNTGLEVENNAYDALRWGYSPQNVMHRMGSSLDSLLSPGESLSKARTGTQLNPYDSLRGSFRQKGKSDTTPKASARPSPFRFRPHPSVSVLRSMIIPVGSLPDVGMAEEEVHKNSGDKDHAEMSSSMPKQEEEEGEVVRLKSTSNVSLCSERFPAQSPSGNPSVVLPLPSGSRIPQNPNYAVGVELQELPSSFFFTEIVGDEPLDASLSYKSLNPSAQLIGKVYSTVGSSMASDALLDPFGSSSLYRSQFYSQTSTHFHFIPNSKRPPHRFPFAAQKLAPHSSRTTGGMGDSFFPHSSALLGSSESSMQSTEIDFQNHLMSSSLSRPQSSGPWNSTRAMGRVVYGREMLGRGKLLSSPHDTNVASPLLGWDLEPAFSDSTSNFNGSNDDHRKVTALHEGTEKKNKV